MGEIIPGIHLVESPKIGPHAANIYLLVDGDTLALIDAGLPGNLNAVTGYVEGLGMRLEQLQYILITHAHPDHTGGAPALQERTGASIYAHPADVHSNGKQDSVSYLGLFGSSSLPLPFLRRVPADGLLNDGDELPILGGLRAVHTPGHTPGSLCFYLEKAGVLFTGDLIIEHQGALGKNSHAFPGANLKDYQASLAKVASLDYDLLCPGHGEPVRGGAAQQVRALVKEDTSYGLSWRVFGKVGKASS